MMMDYRDPALGDERQKKLLQRLFARAASSKRGAGGFGYRPPGAGSLLQRIGGRVNLTRASTVPANLNASLGPGGARYNPYGPGDFAPPGAPVMPPRPSAPSSPAGPPPMAGDSGGAPIDFGGDVMQPPEFHPALPPNLIPLGGGLAYDPHLGEVKPVEDFGGSFGFF